MIKQIVDEIKDVVKNIPNINTVVDFNPYDINSLKSVEYTTFAWVLNEIQEDQTGTTINLSLFYIDRLAKDNSNKMLIYETSFNTLRRIINTLETEYNYYIPNKRYTHFTEEFADKCAGCFVDISISVELGDCIY